LSPAERNLPDAVPYYRPYNNGGFGTVRPIGGWFGPEITFGIELQERGEHPFAIVKHAIGSTTLAVDWHARDGIRYQEMATAVSTAIDEWTSQGYEPRVAGMLWMQGEYDALNANYAAVYADNLSEFIGAVREDFNSPAMPFVLGRIVVPTFAYRNAVRAAQAEVAESVPGVVMVDTDGVSMKDDQVHFNSQGLLQLGQLFADAMPVRLNGDLDGDWDVDLTDLNTVRNNFGATGEPGIDGDHFPYDGVVGLDDLNAVRNNSGADATTNSTAIPEPSTIALLAIGLGAFNLRFLRLTAPRPA
jgi:hypothetical protein